MEYKVIILPTAISDIEKLSKSIKTGILKKIKYLAENADEIIHHHLKNMPDDLKGLCRIKYGHYRILYWIYRNEKIIKIYKVSHRSIIYKKLI
ncbi:MAG TPA: type II toxin-antitoxin system RelE/ParE family toxin [bacterium]|nr:type II toxin-antitoxin system RelE/ParE family toxin [bacterium]HOM26666.1 type II toxin-antitoxin system RelE/ParE family toxin [bacterium]